MEYIAPRGKPVGIAMPASPSMQMDSDNRARAKISNFVLRVAVLVEDLVGLFPAVGSGSAQLRWSARELDAGRNQVDRSERIVLDRFAHPEMLDLRIGENLVDAIDRPAGHARRI